MARTAQVLHLSESPNDSFLLKAELAEEGIPCQLLSLTPGEDLARAVKGSAIDLMVVDVPLSSPQWRASLEDIQRSRPELPVVVLDGDGSVLMNLGGLTTLARYRPRNLVHVIFDNESLLSVGGFPTATSTGSDLAGIASAAGVPRTATVRTLDEFRDAFTDAQQSGDLTTLVAKVEAVGKANGQVQLRATPRNGAAIAPDLAAFIRERAIAVDELFVERGNLDDVFRQITSSDDGAGHA